MTRPRPFLIFLLTCFILWTSSCFIVSLVQEQHTGGLGSYTGVEIPIDNYDQQPVSAIVGEVEAGIKQATQPGRWYQRTKMQGVDVLYACPNEAFMRRVWFWGWSEYTRVAPLTVIQKIALPEGGTYLDDKSTYRFDFGQYGRTYFVNNTFYKPMFATSFMRVDYWPEDIALALEIELDPCANDAVYSFELDNNLNWIIKVSTHISLGENRKTQTYEANGITGEVQVLGEEF